MFTQVGRGLFRNRYTTTEKNANSKKISHVVPIGIGQRQRGKL